MESNITGSIGICDLEEAKIIKLKQIIPTKLKGRFKNNDIIGNKIIRGNPTEIQ